MLKIVLDRMNNGLTGPCTHMPNLSEIFAPIEELVGSILALWILE